MNTNCPTCGQEVPETENLCSSCGFQFATSTSSNIGTSPKVQRPKSHVKLVLAFLVDRTGSSKQFSSGILSMMKGIVQELKAKINTIQTSIITYGDEDEGQMPILLTDNATVDQALQDAEMIDFNGGGDPSESHLCGLEYALKTINWEPKSRMTCNVVVWFSTADTKPTSSGRSPQDLGQEIDDKKILHYSICEPQPFHYDITSEGGGLIFPISNTPDSADISKITDQVAKSISSSVKDHKTKPMPPTP